jgi:hypothetical protein
MSVNALGDDRLSVGHEVVPWPRVGIPVKIKERKLQDAESGVGSEEATMVYIESEDGHDIKYKTLTWKKVLR